MGNMPVQVVVMPGASPMQAERATEVQQLFHPDGTAIDLSTPVDPIGPVSAPSAAPATTVAWVNPYSRNAFVTLSATGITAVSITGPNAVTVAQKVPSGATTFNFILPKGASYTPTYTGTLTHTVTLF